MPFHPAWSALKRASPIPPPATFELDSRDAVGAPNLTSWPLRRTSGTCVALTPLAGQPPLVGQGITRNGIPGVLFPTTAARAQGGAAASLYVGTATRWTIGVVMAPDEAYTNDPNCGRILSIENASVNSYDHGIIQGSSVPLGGGASTQHNTGIQWPSAPTTQLARAIPTSPASNLPQIVLFNFDNGVLTYQRNGVTLGSRTDAARALAFVDVYIGAAGGAGPITQISNQTPWKGTLWRLAGWVGYTLSAAQRDTWMTDRATEYAISNPSWTPANLAAGTGWWDSRDKYDTSGVWLGGASMDEWSNQFDADLQSRSWINHTPTANPSDGPRLNGYSSLRFDGVNDFMQNQSITAAGLLNAGGFAIYMRLVMRGINAGANKAPGSGSVYTNACGVSDNNGFVGLMFRDTGAGTVAPQAYVYNGATEASCQATSFPIGTEVTVSARSNGTSLLVGLNGTEVAYGGVVGNISNLTNPLNLARNGIGGVPGIAGQFDLRELVICNADLNASDRNNLLTWLART